MRVPRPVGALAVDVGLAGLAVLDAVLAARGDLGETSGVSLLAAVALLARRRWPYVTFALVLPALATAYVLVAPLVALYTVAELRRTRLPLVLCTVAASLAYYLPWPPSSFNTDRPFSNFQGLLYTGAFVGAPVALGLLVRARRHLDHRLVELTESQQREQQLAADTVLTQERTRLAREMHDVVSHKVSLIAVQAGALGRTTADDGARDTADTIRELSVQTLEELRHMVGVLRTRGSRPSELVPQPRLADIPRLVADSGTSATVHLEESAADGRWPDQVERAAYRTVQETLTNVSKHAPGAPVTVRVRGDEVGLRVVVENRAPTRGATVDLTGGGNGLVGLRERAELLGGTFSAGPTAERGFVVEALFPHRSSVKSPNGQPL